MILKIAEMNSQEMEDRLIKFAALVIEICESLPNSTAGKILSGQLTKSSTSSALNYGEARGAELKKDFIHKIGIVLKELRETLIGLKIIELTNLSSKIQKVKVALIENNELVSIFVQSKKTAQQKS
jgi:four helix bundle protein